MVEDLLPDHDNDGLTTSSLTYDSLLRTQTSGCWRRRISEFGDFWCTQQRATWARSSRSKSKQDN